MDGGARGLLSKVTQGFSGLKGKFQYMNELKNVNRQVLKNISKLYVIIKVLEFLKRTIPLITLTPVGGVTQVLAGDILTDKMGSMLDILLQK